MPAASTPLLTFMKVRRSICCPELIDLLSSEAGQATVCLIKESGISDLNLCLTHRTLPLSSTQRTCHQRSPPARAAARRSSLYFSPVNYPPILLGTSSFTATGWEGSFYPRGMRPTDYLAFYAEHFHTVEVDANFYGYPKESLLFE